MRKYVRFLLFFLGLTLGSGLEVFAQDGPSKEVKAEAFKAFNSAYHDMFKNTNIYSNKERIALLEKADSLFRQVESWDYSFASIQLLCGLFQVEREYEKLDGLSKDALYIANTKLEESNGYLMSAHNIRGGVAYEKKRDYKNAILLLNKAIEFGKLSKTSLLEISRIHLNLGACYLDMGDYDQAINLFQKSLQIQLDSANINNEVVPSIFNYLALCYSKKSLTDLSSQNFKKGIQYVSNIRPKQREVDQVLLYLYQNLADLYFQTNQLELSEKYIQLALNLQKGQDFINDNYTYILQGRVYLKQGAPQLALEAFKNSRNAVLKEYKDFKKHPEIGMTHFQTANAWLHQNNLDSALLYYQLALVNNSSEFTSKNTLLNPLTKDLINTLNAIDVFEGKANTFYKKYKLQNEIKDLEKSFDHYALAINAISKTRQSFNAEGSKYTLAEKVIPVYEGAIETAYLLAQATEDEQWLKKAFQFAEANKAAALLEAIRNNEALSTTGIPDSLLQKEYNLKVDIAFYEKLIYEARQNNTEDATQKVKDLNNRRFELDEAYQLLIDHFETNYPDYFALKFKTQKIDLSAIQRKLKDEALLEFFVGDQNIFAFTITNARISCEKILKTDRFESDINSLRNIVSTPPNSKTILSAVTEFSTLSNRLYKNILESSIQNLPSSTQKLIIIPDDILAYIPFSIFIENISKKNNSSFKNLDYLFRRFKISYNYSTALWLKFSQQKNKVNKKNFIGFAPEFSAYKKETSLSPLSCNTQEIEDISGLLNIQDPFTNSKAKLQDFKTNISDHQIVHLATHTALDNENSAFNKIYFSDHPLDQNDLYQLKIDASLVVLSACNTGSGALKKGEGIMSLSRGFIHAGCPSILMSLWSVDDCATADIMLNYYKGLVKGKNKETALLLAKEDYLKSTEDILQAHPYYWAAFVQHGSTEPLKLATSKQWWYWIIGLSLLSLLIIFGINSRSNKKRPL